ncbi:MAG TPA: hypothetical protein VET25_07055 [Aestuariivirgaceae bacterium]|nr:hypothetical protein [Aestuariivirgaceae bacterium]
MTVFRRAVADSSEDDTIDFPEYLSEHEWAEYNLPAALLIKIAAAAERDDDALAFVGLGVDTDVEIPQGSQ